MRGLVIWLLAGIFSITLTMLMFFPANWMTSMVEKQTAGRLTLGDAHGTLWRGSAFIGGAASGSDPLTPLLPGRFSWRLSPMVLLGDVDAELENAAALSQPITVTGNWHQWKVSPGAILLPAERLAALGAPLNTIQPSGQMRLSWEPLQLTRQNGKIGMAGTMKLEMDDIGSRLSPVKPLGSYELAFGWHEAQASVILKTVKGPMLLDGSGMFANGRLQFSGTAQAEAGQEQRLANFLNLLGQRRQVGGKEVIALEFK
ncbi:MAG TPA: type II secretion system protein N [Gallionella sp.]